MTDWQISICIAAGAIVVTSIVMAQQALERIERNFRRIADALENQNRLLERNNKSIEGVGNRLEHLWSPIKGINNALWHGQNVSTGPFSD